VSRGYGSKDLAEFAGRLDQLRATLSPPSEVADYLAYTDGACFGNPSGPGGWAAATFECGGDRFWHLFGHLSSTSNNRAEALGVLGAIEWTPAGSNLTVRSDSELTINILRGTYKVRANTDVWDVIRETIASKALQLAPEWVRGHAGDPLNELADRLSKMAASGGTHVDDRREVRQLAAIPGELRGLRPSGDWEKQFLSSVADQLRRGRALTPKQQAIVDRMRARGAR
jgi:ribonuclease HI